MIQHRRDPRALVACAAAAAAFALTVPAWGQYEAPNPIYAAPGSYYNTATGTGATMKFNLNEIIDGHTVYSYSSAAHDAAMLKLDEDPNNSNNVVLIYNGVSVSKSVVLNTTYNREHMWCNSYGLDDTVAAYSDLWNLRICDAVVNSDRNNDYYDNGGGVAHPNAPDCHQVQGVSWEARPIEKGDIARSMFYMDTRYEGQANDGFPRDLVLVGTSQLGSITTSNNNMGNLDTLLKWNYGDGITNQERRRNHLTYTSDTGPNGWNGTARNQGNRNPFIDHPEWVWSVFGGGNNNSKIYVTGSAPADGTSAATASLRVMKNGAWGSTNVTMSKLGTNPTTIDIATSGNATSPDAGPGQMVNYNPLQRTLAVSLNASTATTGLKTGTVTIDNTDITTDGLGGTGSADGNDTITVNGQVVDNRVITASDGTFGPVIIGSNVMTGTTLSSPGDDNTNTRIKVTGAGSTADANGVSIVPLISSGHLFNGTLITATRNLQGNFSTPGAKSGSATFTVQGEGLLGESVNPVSVNYSATALDHSNASFAAGGNSDAASIDFGYVPAGFAPRTANFDIHNLASGAGAALTASLDVDGVSSSGDGQIVTNVVATNPLTPLAAGASPLTYTATFTPTAAGDASATHTISVSDETIPGATAGTPLAFTTSGRTFTAATFPVTGFMKLFAGETLNTGAMQIDADVTLSLTGPGTVNITGAQSHGSNSSLIASQGTLNVNTDAGAGSGFAAPLAMQIDAPADVHFNSSQHLRALAVNGATLDVSAGGNKKVATASLAIAGGGKIDLHDNDLIVHGGDKGSFTGGAYTGVQGLVQSGLNGGSWDGPGLITSMPDAQSSLTTLAAVRASDALGIADGETSAWNGETVLGSSVLVMYTYAGDANVDGVINADDYANIDFNSAVPDTSDYAKGDFNYDGSINADDYSLIDFNNNAQGAPLDGASLMTAAAVPEPTILGLVALSIPLIRRRRRCS